MGCYGKVGRPWQGPGFQTMAFSAYCLGEVERPCRLQEAPASRWGRARLLGGFCQGWALSAPCTVPGAQPRWHCHGLAAAGDHPPGPGAVVQCHTRCCPNPINCPLCFPIGILNQLYGAGGCSCAALGWGCSRDAGFPSRLWFDVGALHGIWLSIALPALRGFGAGCGWGSPRERSCPRPIRKPGGALQRTCKALIAASVPRLLLVSKV